MTSRSDADRNVKEFLQKYGEEGFLKLYLTNFLFELVNYYLHSEETQKNKENDPGHLMQVNYKGIPYSPESIDKFNDAVKKECANRALEIVELMKKTDTLSKFVSKPTEDPKIAVSLQKALEEILKYLGKSHGR